MNLSTGDIALLGVIATFLATLAPPAIAAWKERTKTKAEATQLSAQSQVSVADAANKRLDGDQQLLALVNTFKEALAKQGNELLIQAERIDQQDDMLRRYFNRIRALEENMQAWQKHMDTVYKVVRSHPDGVDLINQFPPVPRMDDVIQH